ncbi:DNLI1 [Enterospora canceri]|uniref:DNA ligase n=1 Tax=Enterospora canceri TaxID=1081671 RepID=A0A1Y1S569_9MICR|nr:DNLI1 [Enterospora canceri]
MQLIEETSSRIEIQAILSGYYRRILATNGPLLHEVVSMCVAAPYPPYSALEMNVGDSTVLGIIRESTSLDLRQIRAEFQKRGDYGSIILDHKKTGNLNSFIRVKERALGVSDVFGLMRGLCRMTGKNSSAEKKRAILAVIRGCTPIESKFLIRLLETKLKVGLALQTVLVGLATAFSADPGLIKEAYSKRQDFEYLVNQMIKNRGDFESMEIGVVPGIPLRPMMAKATTDAERATSTFEGILGEFKYDGERVQIHGGCGSQNGSYENGNQISNYENGSQISNYENGNYENGNHYNHNCEVHPLTKIFSRNNEDISEKYRDVAGVKLSDCDFILDGEVVAYSNGRIQPFQVLSTRKRKNVGEIAVGVCVFAFDLIYYDGQELLDLPLKERREILRANFTEIPGVFQFAEGALFEKEATDKMMVLFGKSVESGCEGLMLKDTDTPYRPSHRSNRWIKLKKDYLDGLGDSVDLVVMGAYYGRGRRAGLYGGFLLGVYNDENETVEACCKIGTGFDDEILRQIKNELKTGGRSKRFVVKEDPDVFVEEGTVWEVKAASISESPVYAAGATLLERGLSLRFPRFVRIRSEKGVTDATTTQQLIRMKQDANESGSDEWN